MAIPLNLCYRLGVNSNFNMKVSKQLNKLKSLNVEAEKCSTREEAKKIINKANKAQSKINQ